MKEADFEKYTEDRDVLEPFVRRTLARVRERHPSVTLEDITVVIEVKTPSPNVGLDAKLRFARLLSDMDREGVVL